MNIDDTIIASLIRDKESTHQSYAQLAQSRFGDKALGETIRLLMRQYKKKQSLLIPDPAPSLFPPALYRPQVNTLIIADLHTPYHNKEMLDIAIELAEIAKVKEVDIAGDLHNFNQLSSLNKGEPTTPYEVDIEAARRIVNVLASKFIVNITSGNHDEYYVKKKNVTFTNLIYYDVLEGKLRAPRVNVTDYDYLYRGDDWIIGHLSSYDEDPGIIAARLADKHNRNVLTGHDHIRGHRVSTKGYIGVSIGCMLMPDRFWYKSRRLNTFPEFQIGFAMIINNKLYLFSDEGNTDYNGEIRSFDYWKEYFRAIT